MTDRIAAIAAAATALNKFLKPLAVIQEKDGKPSMHYAAGLIIVLTFEVGFADRSFFTTKAEPIIVCASGHRVQPRHNAY